MPDIATMGLSQTTGHDDCPPVIAAEGDPLVTINGNPVMCVGHHFEPHGCGEHSSHQDVTVQGSGLISVNGRPVCRVGDMVEGGAPSTIATGDGLISID